MIKSSSTPAAALLAALLTVVPARGEPPPSTSDTARALYVEGKDLRRAGDLEGSLQKLEAAHALYATPVTALEVGRALALLGRHRRAVAVLESIERLPPKPAESEKVLAARAEAKALVAQYRARLARLVLRIDQEGARVSIDGEAVPAEIPGGTIAVDAGAHRVEIWRGEERAAEDVRVGEGEERVLTLRLPARRIAQVQPPPPAPPRPLPPPPRPKPAQGPSPFAIAAFGVAGAGFAAGAITGVMTLARAGRLKEVCRNGACLPNADLATAQALGDASTATFVIGGVALAGGVALLLFGGERAPKAGSASIRPVVGPAGAGLVGVF
jgi:hypothetical protein